MTHISGFERSQLLLLPEALDDYVEAENPVWFIDAFVDVLDLAAAGFDHVEPKATGRPGYAPAQLRRNREFALCVSLEIRFIRHTNTRESRRK
jgi:hypothetical protein